MTDSLTRLNTALAGRYAVEREIGHGGMATVFVARDLRHDRRVALKLLRPELAAVIGADRFSQEIRTTANLQHPHILPLHDSGAVDGTVFYVMPFVEGESLRDRLIRETQLPVDDAVRLIGEVASALDYAHRHGVVHRDIKPENILLHDGRALVADFGIALAVSRTEGSTRLTETGMSLGTPNYMSPEQAMGQRDISARADVYALGAVLYEMLVGEPPFTGPNAQAVVAKILTEKAARVQRHRERVPAHVDEAIATALEKLPADRFASAREFAEAVEGKGAVVRTATPAVATTLPGPRATPWRTVVWAAAAGAIVGAGVYAAVGRWRGDGGDAASEWKGEMLGGSVVAFEPVPSPNGQSIAFGAMVDGQTQIASLIPATGEWKVLTHDRTRGIACQITWSRDNARIYYSRFYEVPQGVWSVSALGGEESLVLPDAAMPEFLPDGSMLIAKINAKGQLQMYHFWPATNVLNPMDAIATSPYFGGFRFFWSFPDGKEAVFFGRPEGDTAAVGALRVIDLATGQTRLLAPEVHLMDVPTVATTADNRQVLLVSADGDMQRVVAVNREGPAKPRTLLAQSHGIGELATGADGSIFAALGSSETEIMRFSPGDPRVERRSVTQHGSMAGVLPLPDGRLLYESVGGGTTHVVALGAAPEPTPFVITEEETRFPAAMLGPDRVVLQAGPDSDHVLAIASIATARLIAHLPVKGVGAVAGSPDGKTIYYVTESAVWRIASTGGTPRQITTGTSVAVDPRGRFLVVTRTDANRVHLVRVWLDSNKEEEIPVHGELHAGTLSLLPNAVGPDGRIALDVISPASWYWPIAILDPATGTVTLGPTGLSFDGAVGWGPDGRLAATAVSTGSTLWRFRPVVR